SSGIWQTVWLEPVPAAARIEALKITPDIDAEAVRVRVTAPGLKDKEGESIRVTVSDEAGGEIAITSGLSDQELRLSWPRVRLWPPATPFLNTLTVTLERRIDEDHHLDLDKVVSYFGMRKISLGQDNGVTKIFLNNKPFFMVGPLDQGFWPDGLYTAPTD